MPHRKDVKGNNAFSLYDLYGQAPAQEPLPRGLEIYNFGKPILCYYYYTLSLSEPCARVQKKIFKEIHQIYNFYPKITFHSEKGVIKYIVTISCLLKLQMFHTKFGQDWTSSSREEDVNGRRRTTDDRRRRTPTHILYSNKSPE